MNIEQRNNHGSGVEAILLIVGLLAVAFWMGSQLTAPNRTQTNRTQTNRTQTETERTYSDPMIKVIQDQKAIATQKNIEESIRRAHDGVAYEYEFLESLNAINPKKTKAELELMTKIRADWRWENGKPIYIGTNTPAK